MIILFIISTLLFLVNSIKEFYITKYTNAQNNGIMFFDDYLNEIMAIIFTIFILFILCYKLKNKEDRRYEYLNKYYLKFKNFVYFNNEYFTLIIICFLYVFFCSSITIDINRVINNTSLLSRNKILYKYICFVFFIAMIIIILSTFMLYITESRLMIRRSLIKQELYYVDKVLIIYDVNDKNYEKLINKLSCIEDNYIFIDYHDFKKYNFNAFSYIKGFCIITDLTKYFKYDKDLKELFKTYFSLNTKINNLNIIVLDTNDNFTSEERNNLSHKRWLSLYKYKNENNYIDVYLANTSNIDIIIYSSNIKDSYIEILRKQLFLSTKDKVLLNAKNYFIYTGLLIHYFLASKNSDNILAKENINNLFTYIENNDNNIKNKMYSLVYLNTEEQKIIRRFNEQNFIGYKFEDDKALSLNSIIVGINIINNKTIGHGQASAYLVDNLYDVVLLLVKKYEEILNIDSLKIYIKDNEIYIKYNNESTKIKEINGIEPIIIEKNFPCFILEKEKKNSKLKQIVRRNYFEGDEYTPKDINI